MSARPAADSGLARDTVAHSKLALPTDLASREVASLCGQVYREALRAIILTGSAARDEATFVHEPGMTTLLGDLDLLLVFEERSPLPAREDIELITAKLKERLLKSGIACELTLNAVHPGYLERLERSIFAYELFTCGRVIAGDADILGLVPRFSARDIPLEDAWRLLANRVVEQLAGAGELAESNAPPSTQLHYRTVKLYLDMATSLLVFAGRYVPTYASRAEALSHLAASSDEADAWPFPLKPFSEAVSAATRWKISPSGAGAFGASTEPPRSFWEQAVSHALALWRWELAQLTGASPQDSPATLMRTWMRRQSLSARLRGWAYVVRRRRWLWSTVHWPRWASQLPLGSPRYLVYAAASSLLFALHAQLGSNGAAPRTTPDLLALRAKLPSIAHRPGPDVAIGWRELADDIVANYREFLVDTRA